MNQMRLHLLGVPHTQTTNEFSHCAFTGKVKRFAPMMRSLGYEVIHYGIEGADSNATYNVDVMSFDMWTRIRTKLFKEKYGSRSVMPSDFIGDLAHRDNELYKTFNKRLKKQLAQHIVNERDIICLPFGLAHEPAVRDFSNPKVETGIGYPDSFGEFRIFESNAWYNYTMGVEQRNGNDYFWVIPNYYDISEWDFNPSPEDYIAYFGRLDRIKGVHIVTEIAKRRPDLKFKLCGQGDPKEFLLFPNMEYVPPIHGRKRSTFLGNAMAVIMPTRYVEPFGGVTVEAALCGTPTLGSSYGSFTETVQHGKTGYRCHTLGDFLAGLEQIENGILSRKYIREFAVQRYDMYRLANKYNRVFQQIADLFNDGWFAMRSEIGPINKAVTIR